MPNPTTVGSSGAAQYFESGVLEVTGLEQFQKILDSGELDLSTFQHDMSYLGFDKQKIAKLAARQLGAKLVVKLLYLGAMRGTNLKKIIEKSVKVDQEVRVAYEGRKILSNGTGASDLTMGRLMGTFPEIAAYYSLKHPFQKKIESQQCPAALQWPAAASLPMSPEVRAMHVEFCVEFASTINSIFHEGYYRAAFNGQLNVARLDPLVRTLCGNPVEGESKNVDLERIFRSLDGEFDVKGKKRAPGGVFIPPQLGL